MLKELSCLLLNVNVANEAACRASLMDMDLAYQELSEKYEAIRELLEKENQEKVQVQEMMKELEESVAENQVASAQYA